MVVRKRQPARAAFCRFWNLDSQLWRVFQKRDHAWAVLADVLAIVALQHGDGGVAHLLLEPLQRHRASGEQLAGVCLSAVVRPLAPSLGRCQVRAPESLERHVRAAVRRTGAAAMEYESQRLALSGFVVPVEHPGFHRLGLLRVQGHLACSAWPPLRRRRRGRRYSRADCAARVAHGVEGATAIRYGVMED